MVNKHLERLLKHKESLEKSFDNMIEITGKDLNKKIKEEDENEDEEINLKDDKIKTYAEGILKSHQTIQSLVVMLKQVELEIETAKKELDSDSKTETETKEVKKEGVLNKHLKG